MADQRITQLTRLLAADAQATVDVLPVADVSTAETKKITLADAVTSALGGISDGSIPGAKLQSDSVTSLQIGPDAVGASELANGAVDTGAILDSAVTEAKLATNAVTSSKIADSAVTSAELADNAVDTAAVQDKAVTTDKIADAAITQVKLAAGVVGTAQLADGGVTTTKVADDAIVTAKIDDGAVTAAKLAGGAVGSTALGANSVTTAKVADGAITAAKLANDLDGSEFLAQGAKAVLIGPGAGGAAVPSFRLLVPTDIPKLEAANLPVATPTALGAVKVGAGLAADGSGVLGIANTVTGGTSSKVTFNAQGLITAAASLSADDIPSLPAGKLTTGTLDVARLPDGQITGQKLANYATTLIQEAEPAGTDHYTGQFWYRESDAQLRTWSGNSWIPVGFGRLSEENLRFCGTFDASTGLIQNVTTFGTTAGLTAGTGIPAAAEALTGVYLVAVTPGAYNGDTYDNGDWVLCIGTSWIRVDTLSSAGGAATIKLEDLLDVTITTPQSGDSLIFDATTNTWKNRTTHGVKINLIELFDGARTSFTTTRAIVSENNLLISLGGVIQEPGVDFTAVVGSSTISFVAPPPAGIDYWILQEASVDSGGGGGGGTVLPPGTAAEEYLQWNSTLSAWRPSTVLTGGTY